jgi:hypothetical protein
VNEDEMIEVTSLAEASKPRLVLMGEFSAGKSTLSNIILDSQPLPMKVTATRLPPVQISYGPPGAFAVAMDGTKSPIALDSLETVCMEETALIEVHVEAEALKLCDLLDMPGISDPNMPQEMWEDVITPRDHVIWCTHATQAWRQSEAAIWNILRPQSSGTNLLLITQFDKLQNDRDRMRVRKRVEKETEGLFDAVYPVSLLTALNAGEDESVWEESGVAAFSEHVIRLLSGDIAPDGAASVASAPVRGKDLRHPLAMPEPDVTEIEPRIMPRRVASGAGSNTRRRPVQQDTVGFGG